MKNYIGLLSVVGAMILSGCAGATPQPVEPTSSAMLTSAELEDAQLAASPYERMTIPLWAQDPWGEESPSQKPQMSADDPWAPSPPPEPVKRTWGSELAAEYGF
jgi:hypothetical protein